MRVGYARVSTPDQSADLQRDALEQSGCGKIFHEVASGAKVVWRLDRLGRSLGQLMALMNTLRERGIGFQSLVEAVDTTTPTGQFFFQVTGAFAERERNLMRERTKAGLASARRRGRQGGAAQSH